MFHGLASVPGPLEDEVGGEAKAHVWDTVGVTERSTMHGGRDGNPGKGGIWHAKDRLGNPPAVAVVVTEGDLMIVSGDECGGAIGGAVGDHTGPLASVEMVSIQPGTQSIGMWKDDHVRDIISALCQNPAAREALRLGSGFRFDSHANALDEEAAECRERDTTSGRMQPDQFCVHRLDGDSSTLLMTVEYKPPHKLSTENLCAGLRPLNFWEEVVNTETVPTDKAEKLRYNAARLTGAALVQEYHVMIQEGLAYSCLSTGLALVFLHVPEEDPTTLYYRLCLPNEDVQSVGDLIQYTLQYTLKSTLTYTLKIHSQTHSQIHSQIHSPKPLSYIVASLAF